MKELVAVIVLLLASSVLAILTDWYIRAGMQGHTIPPNVAYDPDAEWEHEVTKFPREVQTQSLSD